MELDDALHFETRAKWRRWLEKNHNKKDELWLLRYKAHSDVPCISLAEAVEEALCFGWIDGKLKRVDDERYILRFTPRKKRSVWSLINKDRAERLIAEGLMTGAGMEKIKEAKANGMWDKAYTSLKKESLPKDLRNALKEDGLAWNNFQAFPTSAQNNYIGWVKNAKRDETRERRILIVVERARDNKRPGRE